MTVIERTGGKKIFGGNSKMGCGFKIPTLFDQELLGPFQDGRMT